MSEAKAFVLGKCRRRRADELLADERREMRLDPETHGVGRQFRDRASMEYLALDGAALHDDANVAVERIDARLQERMDRRRDRDLAVAVLANHCEHLLDEERVPG
jgi:hypothetical protein